MSFAASFRASLFLAGLGCAVGACSAGGKTTGNGSNGSGSGAAGGVTLGNGGGGSGGGGTGSTIDLDSGIGGGVASGPCAEGGWQCKIDACDGTTKTTVRAKIYDPAGLNPLYNVAVYVPNATVEPIADGAVCETCATPVSGQPIASALTNAAGEFTMVDVPTGTDVPMVIQIGKWRREITLPEVKSCQENVFDDANTFRLPRNQSEGHLPKIAMTTGGADSLQCLLMRIGVDPAEFTNPDGTGRVNLFTDTCDGCEIGSTSYSNGGGTFPDAEAALFPNLETLKTYDIVLMSCRASQSGPRDRTTAQKQIMKDYVDGGGRVFFEHYEYAWLRGGNESLEIEDARKYPMTPFPVVATWDTPDGANVQVGEASAVDYNIDTTFPKGNDFADWLVNVGASPSGKGIISLLDVKHPAIGVEPVSQRWIYRDMTSVAGVSAIPYFSVNTPIEQAATPENQCGRLVHTGVHVAVAANDDTESPFNSGCTSAALTAQEKAMEFLLFDLSSCVMDDKAPPEPPPVVK